MLRNKARRAPWLLLGAVGAAWSAGIWAQPTAYSDIYVTASEVADEVELIREAMGRPYDESPRLPVSGVTELELYFHARTLVIKTNRLAVEIVDLPLRPIPSMPEGEVGAADTAALVDLALQDIRQVRVELGIQELVEQQERDTPISPTGVFSVILDTNRQLNILIDATIRSEDVYSRLATAVSYAAGIQQARTGSASLPNVPFEGSRRPAHTYLRMLDCIDVIADIAAGSGVSVVSLSARRNVPDDIEAGHVMDLVQFAVADLMLIADRLGTQPVAFDDAAGPKHVFPSHTYQRAGVLQQQLNAIAASF